MKDQAERLARNAQSKACAEHDGEGWSVEEQEQLRGYWDGTEETLAEIADILGRTIEACRQRFYETRKGHVVIKTKTTITTEVTGWLVGFCFECGRFGDIYTRLGGIGRCVDCDE